LTWRISKTNQSCPFWPHMNLGSEWIQICLYTPVSGRLSFGRWESLIVSPESLRLASNRNFGEGPARPPAGHHTSQQTVCVRTCQVRNFTVLTSKWYRAVHRAVSATLRGPSTVSVRSAPCHRT
jgi:hypothetical protein